MLVGTDTTKTITAGSITTKVQLFPNIDKATVKTLDVKVATTGNAGATIPTSKFTLGANEQIVIG